MSDTTYAFNPGERSILTEIFLPKRISLQGRLYDTLESGLDHERVKKYLIDNAQDLMQRDLKAYPHWFNPNRYASVMSVYSNPLEAAKARMRQCKPVFFGWSTYEVSGVFLKKNSVDIDEEQTQIVRIIFKYGDVRRAKHAEKYGCYDVYRAILYRIVSLYGLTNGENWDKANRDAFIEEYPGWNTKQKGYASRHFVVMANDVSTWIDDCGIFLFGFLMRNLWSKITELNRVENKRIEKVREARKKGEKIFPRPRQRSHLEDEIWVSGIFHYDINILRPMNPPKA